MVLEMLHHKHDHVVVVKFSKVLDHEGSYQLLEFVVNQLLQRK